MTRMCVHGNTSQGQGAHPKGQASEVESPPMLRSTDRQHIHPQQDWPHKPLLKSLYHMHTLNHKGRSPVIDTKLHDLSPTEQSFQSGPHFFTYLHLILLTLWSLAVA